MKLKDINEIKEDGLVVFMPSGIQATLFNEGENILVKYYNLTEDKYTHEDFYKLINEGIFIFNDRPNSQVIESKEDDFDEDLHRALESYADGLGCNIGEIEDKDAAYDYVCDYLETDVDYKEMADYIDQCAKEIQDFLDELEEEEDMDESVLKESQGEYKLVIITGRDRGDDGKLTKESFQADNDLAALLYVFENYDLQNAGMFNGDYEDDDLEEDDIELKNNILNCVKENKIEEGVKLLTDLYFDNFDISDYYDDIISLTAPDGHVVIEDDIDIEDWFGDDYEDDIDWEDEEDEDDMDESILTKLSKKGFIRESLSKQYENKMDEAFENVKNPQGNVYKAMQGREKHYLTPEFKLEMLQNLDKIQKQFPDMHIRQQAQTFMNELTMQEYYDIKVIQKFIDNYVDIMNPKNESLKESLEEEYGVEYRNMHDGIHYLLVTDSKEKAEQILAYLKELENPDTTVYDDNEIMDNSIFTWDEINKLATDGFEVDYKETEASNGIYNGIQIINYDEIKPDIYESLKEDKEEDLNKLQRLQDKEAENVPNGSKEMYKLNKKYGKLRKKVHKHYAKNENVTTMAEDIRNGNKSGEDPEFGAWLLETSVDEKWEQLTKAMQMYLLDGIADYVQQGSLKEEDLILEIDPEAGLTKEDVLSLDMFSDEEIDTTYKYHDLQLHAFISYEIKSDKQAGNDKQESFKLKKKKNKKQKIEDSINEGAEAEIEELLPGYTLEKELDRGANAYRILVDVGGEQEEVCYGDDAESVIAELVEILAEDEDDEWFEEQLPNVKNPILKAEIEKLLNNSINEAIYLKNKDGNEIGPFKDQDAKEEYIKEQKQNGYQGEFEEIIKENKKEEKMSKDNLTENCYKVYNTLEPDAQPACFNSWNEIDDYLNQTWGEYKVDMAKKNDGFGTQQDYDNYLSNFEVAIEPIEIPAEQIPAEGIDFEVADECPDCEPELTEPAEEPMNMEAEQEVEDEIEDDMDEDFEDEHIGKSEEEPAEEEPTEEDPDVEPTEIDNPKDALNRIEDVEDAVDNIEDYIKTLLSDEDIEEVEDMHKQKTEDFKDNMGMLTDMNDLDFPDALADTVDTKEDGSLYRISDVAKEIEDLKATIEQLKNDFKSELTTLVQDLKNDLKLSVNNVENKVQDTKNAVDNLTSEEEDLEDLEVEEPLEGEEPAQEESEEPTEDEENMEENYDEEALKGNKMYESIKEIIATKTGKVISIPTIAERLREEYGIDANLNTSYGKIIYTQVADLINKTSLRESVVDPRIEEKEKRKSLLGKAANWIGGGLMSRLQESAEKQRWEALEQIKQEIDKKVQQGADAQELKDTITLASENDEEAKQAKDYAVNKLKTTAKVENLKDKLLKTSKTATFKDLNIRG